MKTKKTEPRPIAKLDPRHEAAALARIDDLDDPLRLRQMMKNARTMGSVPVHDAAFRRLTELSPGGAAGSVEYDFWKTIHAFEELLTQERGRTTRLTRTRQKLDKVGAAKTLEDFCTAMTETSGFQMLIERGLPEMTGEAVVLRHKDRFPPSVIEAARARLESVGVDVEAMAAAG